MTALDREPLAIVVDDTHSVSGLLCTPQSARACYVMAHGAGAGMTHPFMESVATDLAARRIATLRFQFPFMEAGGRRPDSPALAQATVRAAAAEARRRRPGLPVVAGGKSYGGRMTSQAQAAEAIPGVRGLVFLGFPLHPAKRPSDHRAKHLLEVQIPMLFVQGTRDALAEVQLMEQSVARLGARATLHLVQDADHSFHVPVRSGRTDDDVRRAVADLLMTWIFSLVYTSR